MKVFTDDAFLASYTSDPAAAPGRMESILRALGDDFPLHQAGIATMEDISAIHTSRHIQRVKDQGLYTIAALAAGLTIQAACTGLSEPSFALVRPPGHHASPDSAWGFCYFNNMAVALEHLRRQGRIETAYVLDFDLHYGDGTVACLRHRGYVTIHNPASNERHEYLEEVAHHLSSTRADIIGVSAGFDNHVLDWGGLLTTEDYQEMGRMVNEHARRNGCGCFAVLEGGYNHQVLGKNVRAFLLGLQGK